MKAIYRTIALLLLVGLMLGVFAPVAQGTAAVSSQQSVSALAAAEAGDLTVGAVGQQEIAFGEEDIRPLVPDIWNPTLNQMMVNWGS